MSNNIADELNSPEAVEAMRMMQDELARINVTGESGGGLVKISMNGQMSVRKITIDPTLLGDDKDMLEDLLAAAFNDAVTKINAAGQRKLSQLTAGMGAPSHMVMRN